MSLDDRLRGAYHRQLEDVQQRVESEPQRESSGLMPGPRRRPAGRVLAVAAALGVILAGAAVLNRVLADTEVSSLQTEAADDGGSGVAEGQERSDRPLTEPRPTTTAAPTAAATDTTASSGVTATSPPSASASTDQEAGQETAVSTSTPLTGAVPATVPPSSSGRPSDDTETARGVSNDVCASGFRAELEWAAVRYVGDNRGWGRKDDLVDEQDGPFYFQAWEPNYELPVSVEIILNEPVLATDVRVAQDPFTPVAGIITVEAADQRFEIELSGTDGWRVHTFDTPTVIDRLTIGRDARESNIMEVLLCVEPPR